MPWRPNYDNTGNTDPSRRMKRIQNEMRLKWGVDEKSTYRRHETNRARHMEIDRLHEREIIAAAESTPQKTRPQHTTV